MLAAAGNRGVTKVYIGVFRYDPRYTIASCHNHHIARM